MHGVEAMKVLVDLSTLTGAKELMSRTVAAYGRIDVLVNNVGGTIWIKPFHLYTEEEVAMELQRSLYPTLWCCLAVLPIMMKQQSGSIVNLGSQSTRGLYRLPYATSKGGILALTKVMAMEYGRYGIRINAMAPGGTEISDRVVPRQFIKPGVTVDEPGPRPNIAARWPRTSATSRRCGGAACPRSRRRRSRSSPPTMRASSPAR